MIESKNRTSKNLEKALQALEQAKRRVANEKNRTRRNAKPRITANTSWAALSVLRQPTGEAILPLRRKRRAYPFVNFAFRQKPKCGFYLNVKSMGAPHYPVGRI